MATIKVLAPVFERGVMVFKAGDVVEVSDETAQTAIRRGWGELCAAPVAAPAAAVEQAEPAAAAETAEVPPKGKKARG